MKNSAAAKKVFLTMGIILYLAFLLYYINGSYPWVGHDYRYFISRLFETYIHYQKNGLTIQWFSPTFGGGLPAYHNPLHIQFSITQFLAFIMTPWLSIIITTAIFTVIGYYASYRFARDILNTGWRAAILGALFFVSSGFYIQHMAAGALSYSIYPAVALIFYLLFSKKLSGWFNGIMIGLILALTIHISGFYLLVVVSLSFLILPPLIYLIAPEKIDFKRFLLAGLIGGVTAGLLVAGKLYAIFSFMEHFPRDLYLNDESFNTYYTSLPSAVVGFTLQYIGIPFFTLPFRVLMEDKTATVQMMTALIGGQQLGIWEMDTSLSPVLIYVFLYQLRMAPTRIKAAWHQHSSQKFSISAKKLLAVVFLFFAFLFTFQFATKYGFLFEITRHLPVIRSLTTTSRFASSLLFPLSMLGAHIFHKEFQRLPKQKQASAFYFFLAGTLVCLGVYFLLPFDIQSRGYDVRPVHTAYHAFNQGTEMYISDIAVVQDSDAFLANASSRYPYEPIFGYDLEQFTPKVVPGPIEVVDGQHYNLTNPESLVYDTEELFARFTLDEREKMLQFANYQQPDWDIPRIQHTLNTVSLVSLIFAVGIPSGYLIWKKIKENGN